MINLFVESLTFVVRRLIQEGYHRTEQNLTSLRERLDCVTDGQVTDGDLLSRSELNLRLRRKACRPT